MILALDRFFLHLAKKMIILGEFLGIHRKQIAYLVVILGYFSVYGTRDIITMGFGPSSIPKLVFWISAITFIFFFIYKRMIDKAYREDDILSPSLCLPMAIRLVMLPMPALFSLIAINLFSMKPVTLASLLPAVLSPEFYPYILLNQSPQNPLRLRNLVKNALGKIKAAFRPAPQPQPQPEPIPLRSSFPSPTA